MIQYFFVACTARTGSTLLCRLLAGSGVAGDPIESFNPPIEQRERQRLGIGNVPIEEYIEVLKQEVMPTTGRFGFKLHIGRRQLLIDRLRSAMGAAAPKSDRDVLEHFFPGFKVIYLMRDDFLAQAVSLLRAKVSGEYGLVEGETPVPIDPNIYDADALHWALGSMALSRREWLTFFEENDIKPLHIYYEDMIFEQEEVFHRMLAFLGEENPTDFPLPEIKNRIQRDETSALWYERFLNEVGAGAVVQAVGKAEFCEAAGRQIVRLQRQHPDIDTGMLEVQRQFLCSDQRIPDAPPPEFHEAQQRELAQQIARSMPMRDLMRGVLMKLRR